MFRKSVNFFSECQPKNGKLIFWEKICSLPEKSLCCKNRRFKKRNNSKSFIWKKNIFYKFFLLQIRRLFQEDIVCWTNFSLPKGKFLNLKSSWQLAKKKVNNKKFGFEKKKKKTYKRFFFHNFTKPFTTKRISANATEKPTCSLFSSCSKKWNVKFAKKKK